MRAHEVEFSTFEGGIFTDLVPYQYGREVCVPGHAFGPARRSHYLFHYIIQGSGSLTAINESGSQAFYDIKSGEGFLIFPGQTTTYVADLNDPWEYIWIEFDGSHVKASLDHIGFSPTSPIYRMADPAARDEMLGAMRRILEHRNDSPLYLVGCTYLFFDAFLRSAESHRIPQTTRLHGFYIDSALSFIEKNYQSDVSIEDIARYIGLNRSYFGKVFKEGMGVSPQQFLIGYRMEKACELLKLSSLSIGEVGRSVGYPNQLHFSRAFRNTYGTSPRTWRQQHTVR